MIVRMAPKNKNKNKDNNAPPPLPQARKIPIQYKEILKEFADKQALTRFRHDALLRQRNANYRGEYERLRGHMHALNMGLGNGDIERLRNRAEHLVQLARLGLNEAHP